LLLVNRLNFRSRKRAVEDAYCVYSA
jgi:hypothetical protein